MTNQTGPARHGSTERCTNEGCGHTKRDHSGRRDHREKYGPVVAGDPWCHACGAECLYEPPAAVSAAVAPPTQAALRDRIAQALAREDAHNAGYDHGFVGSYGADDETDGFVDAVLAVLPPATDRAAVLREAIDVAREEGHRLEEEVGIEAARGARCVAYLLRKLLAKEQPPRRMADETATTDVEAILADGPVRCPLCPTPLTLHTPSGARAHFTTVHPEQRITGRSSGPWPLLVTDETATETPARDCPACDAGIGHSEHCPTPESHKWGCGCHTEPAAGARQDGATS